MISIIILGLVIAVLFFIFEKRKKINITTPKIPWKKILWIVFILGIIIIGVYFSFFSNSYPTSGEATTTQENPVKLSLNPRKTWIEVWEGQGIILVYEKDKNYSFVCDKIHTKEGEEYEEYKKQYERLPRGKYKAYPLSPDKKATFTWWQD